MKELKEAYNWTEKNRPDHLKTLINRRSGSTWFGQVSNAQFAQIIDANWTLLTTKSLPFVKEGCDYYSLPTSDPSCPEFAAKSLVAIRSLRDFQDLSQVFLVAGDHGIELISCEVQKTAAKEIWLIIGSAIALDGSVSNTEKMIWTCHPGKPMASIKSIVNTLHESVQSIYDRALSLGIDYAVKKMY